MIGDAEGSVKAVDKHSSSSGEEQCAHNDQNRAHMSTGRVRTKQKVVSLKVLLQGDYREIQSSSEN